MSFRIVTDSSANLTDELIAKYDIKVVPLVYFVGDNEYLSYIKGRNNSDNLSNFYAMLRKKEKVSTSCINEGTFIENMEEELKQGHDVLYIGFSSALSLTYQSGEKAANTLKEKYPDRTILAVDTLGASLGQGLLVTLTADLKESGASINECYEYVLNNRLHLCHWFTVDDLFFLFRGGRVKSTQYIAGSLLNIKPVMHMDNEGRLIPVSKVIGRKKALNELANKLVTTILPEGKKRVYISHGDCIDDVNYLKSKILEQVQIDEFIEYYVDPVVGAHSGPGTVALFFLGTQR